MWSGSLPEQQNQHEEPPGMEGSRPMGLPEHARGQAEQQIALRNAAQPSPGCRVPGRAGPGGEPSQHHAWQRNKRGKSHPGVGKKGDKAGRKAWQAGGELGCRREGMIWQRTKGERRKEQGERMLSAGGTGRGGHGSGWGRGESLERAAGSGREEEGEEKGVKRK